MKELTMAKNRLCALSSISVAYCLCILLPVISVLGNYVVEVHVQSYSNPTNRCATCYDDEDQIEPGCCDDYTVTTCNGHRRCDNQFLYCLTSLNTSAFNASCGGYIGTINSGINWRGQQINFSQPRVLGLPNPIKLTGLTDSWQGAQLYVEVNDYDQDILQSNEFVDSFTVNITSNTTVGRLIERNSIQSTFGWANMSLTVRVLCTQHFYGERCENLNECTAFRSRITCSGQRICVDGVGTYTCECEPGYTGTDCENNIDDCVGVNCNDHGTCTDGVNSFNCDCDEGFSGTMCETNIDDCVGVNCSGHGQCIDGVNNFTCLCQPGFTGVLCSVNTQEQSSSAGEIAGGVIGILLAVILIVMLLILIVILAVKRRQLTDKQGPTPIAGSQYIPGDNPVYGAPEDTTQSVTNGTSTMDSNTAEFDNPIYGANEQEYETPNTTNEATMYETPVPVHTTVGDDTKIDAYAVSELNLQLQVPGDQTRTP